MTETDDPATIAERYQRAVNSSHLRAQEGRCDVDMLIAAGKLSSPLGALLWRLRGEFDAARATLSLSEGRHAEWELQIAELQATAEPLLRKPTIVPAELRLLRDQLAEIARTQAELRTYLVGERGMLLMRLRSLYATKRQLLVHVLDVVQGDAFAGMTHDEASTVAMRVLDAWLDPACVGCEGRGFNGGAHRGEQKVGCRACRGTGARRTSIARNGQQRLFADRIDAAMGEAMFTTEVEMRGMLRELRPEGA